MSYLTINDFVVPVAADSLRVDVVEVGNKDRSLDGSLLSDVNTTKLKISGRTALMLPVDAALMRCLLQGNFDTLLARADFNSGKGVVPSTTDTSDIVPSIATDGGIIDDAPLSGVPNFGYHSFVGGQVNILDANMRDVEDGTTGFTAIDSATITRSADHAWQGTYSLKVVTSATVNAVAGGVYCEKAATGAGPHFASVYVTGSGVVKMRIQNTDTAYSAYSDPVTLVPGHWTRIILPVTTTGADNLRLSVVESVADSGITFYCDGLSINLWVCAPAWADPTPAAMSDPAWDFTQVIGAAKEFTVLAWIRPKNLGVSLSPIMLRRDEGVNPTVNVQVDLLAISANSRTTNDEVSTLTATDPIVEGAWALLALAFSPKSTASRPKLQLFVNDANNDWYDYDNPTTMPQISDLLEIASYSDGMDVAGIYVLGHALTRTQYQALYAAWTRQWVPPLLNVAGDAITAAMADQVEEDGDPLLVRMCGRVTGQKHIGASRSDGTWDNNLTEMDFELEEI